VRFFDQSSLDCRPRCVVVASRRGLSPTPQLSAVRRSNARHQSFPISGEDVMEINGKKHVVLYLEDWQIRMVKDFLGVDCHQWVVPVGGTPSLRYGIRIPTDPTLKRMYFTDWQKREIKDIAGESCDFVELRKGMIVKYGVPVGAAG
jgi:hypothetical protein